MLNLTAARRASRVVERHAGPPLIVRALPSGDHVSAWRELRDDREFFVDVERLSHSAREYDAADERARESRVQDIRVLGESEAQRLRVNRNTRDDCRQARPPRIGPPKRFALPQRGHARLGRLCGELAS